MPDVTVAVVSKMFPQTPLDPIETNLPHVLGAPVAADLTRVPIVLATRATIRAGTEGFAPISEGLSRFNTSPGGHPSLPPASTWSRESSLFSGFNQPSVDHAQQIHMFSEFRGRIQALPVCRIQALPDVVRPSPHAG